MSKKNRNRNTEHGSSNAVATASPVKPPRKPRGTFVACLAVKADTTYAVVNRVLTSLRERGAPSAAVVATADFMGQIETWREAMYALATWTPANAASSKAIVEGDAIGIGPEHQAVYAYIFEELKVLPGDERLVAGTVVIEGKRARVFVKSADADGHAGKFFGYIPRNHLIKK